MTVDYPSAQWFDPPPRCRDCGKPGGALMGYGNNAVLGYFCLKHAEKHIRAAHRQKRFEPDESIRGFRAEEVSGGEDIRRE